MDDARATRSSKFAQDTLGVKTMFAWHMHFVSVKEHDGFESVSNLGREVVTVTVKTSQSKGQECINGTEAG